jgi:transposase InsO family protein
MCEHFGVSPSGYYAWKKRDDSEKEADKLSLVRKIEEIHMGSRGTYGSPRVFNVLKGLGESCSEKKVAKLMKENGIRAKTKRKFRVTTDSKHNLPVAPNLLQRNFSPENPNEVWASDITYVWTKEGWLFLAVIVDLFSRQIVGWSIDKTMTRELVLTALRQAYFRRKPGTGLVYHSDRGSQYCAKEFREQLKQYRMIQSQSRKGDCWDNAVVESFFHTLKTEAIFHEEFETRAEAIAFIFEWIEVFYNRKRLHSTLGYMSPVAFEESTCL